MPFNQAGCNVTPCQGSVLAVARPRTDSHAAHGVHSDFDGNHEDMALVNVWQKFGSFRWASQVQMGVS